MYEYLETFWSLISVYCELFKKITCNENFFLTVPNIMSFGDMYSNNITQSN